VQHASVLPGLLRRPADAPIDPFMPLQATHPLSDDDARGVCAIAGTVPPTASGRR